MIGGCDRDRVNIFVLEQLTYIDVGFGLRQCQFLHVPEPQVQDILVHIAERGDLGSGNMRESLQVVIAAATQSANGDAHTIVRAQHLSPKRERCCAQSCCFTCRFEEIPPINRHVYLPLLFALWSWPSSTRLV